METIRKDARAVLVVGAVFMIVSLIGFTPRYFAPLFAGGYVPPSAWMHAHAVSTLLWLLVFLVQPALVLGRRIRQHKTFGRAALVVAAVTVATGFALQLDLLPLTPGDTGNLVAFTARFVAGLAVFVPAVVFAVVYRRRTAWHLRLMYVATMSLMPSPFGRILVEYLGMSLNAAGPWIGLINFAMIAVLPLYDRLAHGKVERISWVAFAVVVAAQILVGVLLGSPDWAARMTGQSN